MNRRIGCFGTLGLLFLFALVVQWAQQAWFWIVLGLAIAGFVAYRQLNKRTKQDSLTHDLLTMAAVLETQANNLSGPGLDTGIMLKKDEKILMELHGVNLVEWKSSGSSYEGGNIGVGFRVAKGVSIGVGSSRGQLIKNPATQQVTDTGTATFTSNRVLFVGSQRTVEWDLDKLVGMDPGPNGLMVQIAVSNKATNSGLMVSNHDEVTPGIALDIAATYHQDGEAAAIEKCREYAKQLRASVTPAIGSGSAGAGSGGSAS